MCPQRINFLVWWQAPSRHHCSLCVGPSACLSVSEPQPQGKFLGPTACSSYKCGARGPKPQAAAALYPVPCLFACNFTLLQVSDLFFFYVYRDNNIVTSDSRQTLECSSCPALRSVPRCLTVLPNATGFTFSLHALLAFAMDKLHSLPVPQFPFLLFG